MTLYWPSGDSRGDDLVVDAKGGARGLGPGLGADQLHQILSSRFVSFGATSKSWRPAWPVNHYILCVRAKVSTNSSVVNSTVKIFRSASRRPVSRNARACKRLTNLASAQGRQRTRKATSNAGRSRRHCPISIPAGSSLARASGRPAMRAAARRVRLASLAVRGAPWPLSQRRRRRELGGDAHGGEVDVDGVFDAARIAAGHGHRHRHAAGMAQLEDHAVARGEPALGELQAPEAVALERVGAGQIDRQIGLGRRQGPAHALLQRLEIVAIAGAVGQLDVEVARLFLEGEVVGGVDGEGEHGRIARQDRGGAVALVHVAVDDHHALDPALGLQGQRGDGAVVEHAVALAAVAERVVRAAGQVHARRPPPARRAPPRASRRWSAASAPPSAATTGSRCAAALRRAAHRSPPAADTRRSCACRICSSVAAGGSCNPSCPATPSPPAPARAAGGTSASGSGARAAAAGRTGPCRRSSSVQDLTR